MSSKVIVDNVNYLVEADSDLILADIEQEINQQGLSLALPMPHAYQLSVGSFLQGKHAGLRVVPGNRLEPLPVAITAELPNGKTFSSRLSPRRAAGPDLIHYVLGGDEKTAKLRSAVLRLLPVSKVKQRLFSEWNDVENLVRGLKWIIEQGISLPLVILHGRKIYLETDCNRADWYEFGMSHPFLLDFNEVNALPQIEKKEAHFILDWDQLSTVLHTVIDQCGGNLQLYRLSLHGMIVGVSEQFGSFMRKNYEDFNAAVCNTPYKEKWIARMQEALR